MTVPGAHDFQGTARFQIIRRLGAGGMGVVYEAQDRERGCRVALKTVRELGGDDLLRLKNEFRSLQDLNHPNLVSLGDLCEEGGRWFFTMELVQGVTFLTHVRRGDSGQPPVPAESLSSADSHEATAATWQISPARQLWEAALASGPRFDETRLRSAFGQLAQALVAVHAAARVHRDVKPSNVLVTPEGRVVLLDFGLVTSATVSEQSTHGHAVGTAAYMAPEQAASQKVGPAADWYSAGVLLYESLTGQLPFAGTPLQQMVEKQRGTPPRPSALSPGVPSDLDALAASLLHFDPRARPTAGEVLLRLGLAQVADTTGSILTASVTQSPLFVGRTTELEALAQAFAASRDGHTVAVLVAGESGVGKSALVRHFTDGLASHGAVVLAGRCYEREAVPYKAVDGVVDALSRYMAHLPDDEAAALLPRSAALLAEVFPVLRRVKAVAKAPRAAGTQQIDPQELRSRLFAAVRELIGRLADRRPLVMVIDDLQWSDADSLALLSEVVRPPEAPPFLAIATLRLGMSTPMLAISRYMPADVRHVDLGHLPPPDASELAARLLQRLAPVETATTVATAETIAAEADGHPLFIDELVRHLGLHGEVAPGSLRLDEALRLRINALEAGARRVLELVAVAGQPLAHDVVRRAGDLEAEPYARAIGVLRVANFVHSTGARGTDTLSAYHDRVREAVAAQLGPDERRSCHEQLAVALEQAGHPDPEMLATHWRAAGDDARAADYAERAATAAAAAFAFDRAAELYRQTLDLRPTQQESSRELLVKLGHALANAGRGAESAAAYTRAARGASAAEALDLRRLAAGQLMRSGHVDEGLAAIRELAATTGIRLAKTPNAALASLLLRRAMVRCGGYRFTLRDASQISPEQLHRLDYCWWLASALGAIDTIRGNDLNARALRMALRAGEPTRLLRGLATEVTYLSMAGWTTRQRTERVLRLMHRFASTSDTSDARAWAAGATGIADYYIGRFRTALEHLQVAERIFREERARPMWELGMTRLFLLWSLTYRGRMADLARVVPQWLADALDQGDLYAATNLRLSIQNVAWLVGDDAAEARRMAHEALDGWPRAGVLAHDWFGLTAEMQLDLYEGAGGPARSRIERGWRALERSLILRLQNVRIEAWQLRARAALAQAHETGGGRTSLIRDAERDAKRILRERRPWSNPLAELILAGVAGLRGDLEGATTRCRAAASGFDAADMALHAAVACRRQGQLLGGDEGRALVQQAETWMMGQKIKNPSRWAAMLAPGFPD